MLKVLQYYNGCEDLKWGEKIRITLLIKIIDLLQIKGVEKEQQYTQVKRIKRKIFFQIY